MKNFLKRLLGILEGISLLIVAFYGIKYTFVAGPIFFGTPAGYIVAGVITFFFVFPFFMGFLDWYKFRKR